MGPEDPDEAGSPALRLRGFVPVELVRHRAARTARPAVAKASVPSEPAEPQAARAWADRVTLFLDAEL
jgi:hypothetical protein